MGPLKNAWILSKIYRDVIQINTSDEFNSDHYVNYITFKLSQGQTPF